MKGKLIIFSAPSGAGKTTIVKHLLNSNLGLEFSISATSRKPRKNEKEGRDYYFLDPATFRKKIEKGEFLEWEEVYQDQYYGTLNAEVERIRDNGKHVIFDIDVVGGMNLKKKFGKAALSIFVRPPSVEILESRLRNRNTDSEEQLRKRIQKAAQELSSAENFDVVIINDNLETALKEAEAVVRNFIS